MEYRNYRECTNEELLDFMRHFYKDNNRIPVWNDFVGNNSKYPCPQIYKERFGSWNNAIRDSGLWEKRYNDTNICDICREEHRITENSVLCHGNALRETNENGKITGRWLCRSCYNTNYNNRLDSINSIVKSLRNHRIGNLDPNSNQAKGDKFQELACELYEWEDLNKKYDNYRMPIDCYDPNTRSYHQVKGSFYNNVEKYWNNGWSDREYGKEFVSLVFFCVSKDGKRIEMIYRFPKEYIENRRSITIRINSSWTWYEKYRVTDEEELKRANEIWNRINKSVCYRTEMSGRR